jgi:hypothetical protein
LAFVLLEDIDKGFPIANVFLQLLFNVRPLDHRYLLRTKEPTRNQQRLVQKTTTYLGKGTKEPREPRI